MTTVAEVLEALKVPGTVFVGGVSMGMVADVVVRRREIEAEAVAALEFGMEIVEDHYLGEAWSIAWAFRNWTQAKLAEALPRLSVGSGIEYPGSVLAAGTRKSSHARVVRFVPNDSANQPTVEFPSAIPMAAQTFELKFGYEPETLIGVSFLGIRDPGTGELFKMGVGI